MSASFFYLIRPFLIYLFFAICVLTFARSGFAVWQFDRFSDVQSFFTMLIGGLRIDLSTLGYVLILPAIVHPWLMLTRFRIHWLKLLKMFFVASIIAIIFLELATPAFINEYGFRPNRLFIEYLSYPNEVSQMLLNGHLFTLVTVITLLAIISFVVWHGANRLLVDDSQNHRSGILTSGVACTFLMLTLFLCARGTLGHRPINPAFVYFSSDPLVNSLSLNSAYSVAHALKQLGDEKNSAKLYGKMSTEKVISLVRQETGMPSDAFKHQNQPTMMVRNSVYQGKPKNIVIILEESLGAQFVSSLGGISLTLELDKLNSEGWAFKNLFATGTRSVRGIEAVITGFTPTPARAVVKLDKSQRHFFTIANLLKGKGYTTQFIYGGESHFDNMKSFFLGNGFTSIVDFNDFEDPNFVASWGASDEDLFNQADLELSKLHQAKKPFFSLVFTSSNHDPFEIPQRKMQPIEYTPEQLELYDDKEKRRHKAIQYADFALGKFINKAKTQPYWQDTIFLIVADHDARVIGSELVPVKNFHIPGVILNSGTPAKFDERVVSQIDLAPTLLSLAGVQNQSPMLGHDLNKKHAGGRAMMQYGENFAFMKNDKVAILQPQKKPQQFSYDFKMKGLKSVYLDPDLADIALAHALWGSLAYEKDWFHFDGSLTPQYAAAKSTNGATLTP